MCLFSWVHVIGGTRKLTFPPANPNFMSARWFGTPLCWEGEVCVSLSENTLWFSHQTLCDEMRGVSVGVDRDLILGAGRMLERLGRNGRRVGWETPKVPSGSAGLQFLTLTLKIGAKGAGRDHHTNHAQTWLLQPCALQTPEKAEERSSQFIQFKNVQISEVQKARTQRKAKWWVMP